MSDLAQLIKERDWYKLLATGANSELWNWWSNGTIVIYGGDLDDVKDFDCQLDSDGLPVWTEALEAELRKALG